MRSISCAPKTSESDSVCQNRSSDCSTNSRAEPELDRDTTMKSGRFDGD